MKIEITEEVLKLNIGGVLRDFSQGDQVTVDDDVAAVCLRYGWAIDVAGEAVSQPRQPGANGVIPDNVVIDSK